VDDPRRETTRRSAAGTGGRRAGTGARGRRAAAGGRRKRRGPLLSIIAAICVLAGGAVLALAVPRVLGRDAAGVLDSLGAGTGTTPSPGAPRLEATPGNGPAGSDMTTPGRQATPTGPPVLRIPGQPPQAGSESFAIGRTGGAVAGRSGTLRRYRVAVEEGSGEDVEAFGAFVDATLSDPRSWPAGGLVRLQRVPDGAAFSFTIYLATARTAHDMCATGGTNNNVGGRSYTSCRTNGKVIINLDRWRLSVDEFVAARVPLETYRRYVVNHETGHELGNGHERCPRAVSAAPVMMQQTFGFAPCQPNPWPYLNGRRVTG
jgi:hypothetical protein